MVVYLSRIIRNFVDITDLNIVNMQNEKYSMKREIMSRIAESEPGTLFFINSFTEFNNDEMVGKILSEAEKLQKLVRLSRGVYFKPEHTRFGILYPSTEKIIEAIANRDRVKILPTGSTAMNELGFSTQVPMNAVYITTGSSRVIFLGKKKITLCYSVPKSFAFKSKFMALLVQALKKIGKMNITEHDICIVCERLKEQKVHFDIIEADLQEAPIWIKKIISPIIKTIKSNE